jgi:beta-phosphoglucomutase-like phosphatase (HAD superfamily)
LRGPESGDPSTGQRSIATQHCRPDHRPHNGDLLFSWAVVTSGTQRLASASMGKVGMTPPPVLVTADDVGIGKPHPAPFLRAAQLLGTSPSDCVAIEDSPAGMSSARQAGKRVLAVAGTYPAQRLRNATLVLSETPSRPVRAKFATSRSHPI